MGTHFQGIATNGTPACFGKGIELNLSALSPVVELYLPHEHAHTVDLRNDNRRFRRNKFASGDDIDDLFAEFSFAAWTQGCYRQALRPW